MCHTAQGSIAYLGSLARVWIQNANTRFSAALEKESGCVWIRCPRPASVGASLEDERVAVSLVGRACRHAVPTRGRGSECRIELHFLRSERGQHTRESSDEGKERCRSSDACKRMQGTQRMAWRVGEVPCSGDQSSSREWGSPPCRMAAQPGSGRRPAPFSCQIPKGW